MLRLCSAATARPKATRLNTKTMAETILDAMASPYSRSFSQNVSLDIKTTLFVQILSSRLM